MINTDQVKPKDFALKQKSNFSTEFSFVPFVIVPGHHGGMISQVLLSCDLGILLSISGNRKWEAISSNQCILYEIAPLIQ
jgi:transcriptional activator SPT8